MLTNRWSEVLAAAPSYFEEWRKMPRELREHVQWREDYLTARTFGLLRYLPTHLMQRLLSGLDIPVPLGQWDIELWPALSSHRMVGPRGSVTAEPDALLSSAKAVLLVEVKNVGSALGRYLNQLGREWLLSRELSESVGWTGPSLLLVSRDPGEPRVPGIRQDRGGRYPTASDALVSIPEQIVQYIEWSREHLALPVTLPSVEDVRSTVLFRTWLRVRQRARALLAGSLELQETRLLSEVDQVFARMNVLEFDGWTIELPPLAARRIKCSVWLDAMSTSIEAPVKDEPTGDRALWGSFSGLQRLSKPVPSPFLRIALPAKSLWRFDGQRVPTKFDPTDRILSPGGNPSMTLEVTMATDLSSVTNAFGWIQAYFRDVSQFCARIVHEFEGHEAGYTALIGGNLEWQSSKVIDNYSHWMPLYSYQFFYRGAGEAEDGPETESLLAVCLEHHSPDAELKPPTLSLVRFDTSKATRKLAHIKGSITYWWDPSGSEDERGDGWRHGVFQEMPFAFKSIPLGEIESLELVRKVVVDALIEYDIARTKEGQGGDIAGPSTAKVE